MIDEKINIDVESNFSETTQDLENFKDELASTQEEVNSFNSALMQISSEDVFEGLSLSIDGMSSTLNLGASAMAGYQGAMGMLGVESEELEKQLLKVQSAMAFAQGVKGVTDSIKQLKDFGTKALASIQNIGMGAGIAVGAVVTAGVVGITMLMDKLNEKQKQIEKNNEKIEKKLEAQKDIIAEQLQDIEKINQKNSERLSNLDRIYGRMLKIAQAEGDAKKEAELTYEFQEKKVEEIKEQQTKAYADLKKTVDEILEYQTLIRNSTLENTTHLVNFTKKESSRMKGMYGLQGSMAKMQGDYVESLKKQASGEWESDEELRRRAERRLGYLTEINTLYQSYTKQVEMATAKSRELDDAEADIAVERATRARERNERAREFNENTKNLKREIEDLEIEQIEDENRREQTKLMVEAQRRKEDLEKVKASAKEKARLRLEIDKKLMHDLDKLDEEYWKEYNEKQKERQRIEREAVEQAKQYKIQQETEWLNTIEQIQEQNYLDSLSDRDREIRLVEDKYFELETLAEGNAEELAIIEEAKNNELAVINDNYRELEKQKEQELLDAKLGIAQVYFQSLTNFADAWAGEDEKRQKTAFLIKKGADLSNATIDGVRAVLSAYAQTPVPLKLPAAIAAGVFSASQIALIARQKFDGGGQNVEPSGAGAGGGADALGTSAPEFNVVGDSGINQLATAGQEPLQAYVVSGDVTSAQGLDRNRIKNATFG